MGGREYALQHTDTSDTSFAFVDRDGTTRDISTSQLQNVEFVHRKHRRCGSDKDEKGDAGGQVLRRVLSQFMMPIANPDAGVKEASGIFVPNSEAQFDGVRAACEASNRTLVVAYVAVPSYNCQLFFPGFRDLWTRRKATAAFMAVDLSRTRLAVEEKHVPSLPHLRVFLPGQGARGVGCANVGKVDKVLEESQASGDEPRLMFWCICC